MGKSHKILLLFPFLLLWTSNLQSAEILDVELASHRGFTLLLVNCDRVTDYYINEEGELVIVRFPSGCAFTNTQAKLKSLKSDFIAGVAYSKGSLRISVKKNYTLKTYINRRPFQIILDFAHKPGPPPTAKRIIPQQTESTERKKTQSEVKTTAPQTAPAKEIAIPDSGNFQRGLDLKQAGDYRGALEAFLKAVPEEGLLARFQVAMMYEELNQREKAVEELKTVVQESAAWVEPRVKLGLLYKMSGRTFDAEEIWSGLFSQSRKDTGCDYNALAKQMALAEELIEDEGGGGLGAPPPIRTGNLPQLPWFWIIMLGGTALGLLLIRTVSNWRMNRMMKAILRGEAAVEEPESKREEFDGILGPPVEEEEQAMEDAAEEEFEAPQEEPVELVAETEKQEAAEIEEKEEEEEEEDEDELSESKQKKIYELAEQDYSVAEIAKMLNMGQEEVKFILDFRRKKGVDAKQTSEL